MSTFGAGRGYFDSHQLEAAAKATGANLTVWYGNGADHLRAPALYPQEFETKLVGFFRNALVSK